MTTRTRLRDAAIECFALGGFEASVRQISARAGVSPGLVRHHFGTKELLRAECDDEVLRRFREIKGGGIRMPPGEAIRMFSQLDEFAPTFVYILRSVRDGGEVGRAFVEHMIADAEVFTEEAVKAGTLKPSRDPAARARYLVTSSLGGLLVQLTLMPDIDLADIGTAIHRLTESIALPSLELFTEGILVDRSMLDEYLMYVPDPPGTTDATPPHP
ncbi:TetR/AcrR family transcriptional regulator [Glaciibacter superstes]|uniref:TetR/AcrR family transcriptional regulator n=1 Tax=Glaciibacter superstes TaxID=501023 RepID=UPI001FE0D83D|nr:TetR family transcriptional regulator [Glaciibacter superstes]